METLTPIGFRCNVNTTKKILRAQHNNMVGILLAPVDVTLRTPDCPSVYNN